MDAIMGFDFGLARIGVAIGSLASRHAEALTVLQAKNGCPDWSKVDKLVETWQPSRFLVGDLPDEDDASRRASPGFKRLANKMIWFRKTLQQRFRLPIELIDESYSSHEARYLLKKHRQAGYPAKIRKGDIDMVAATVILRSWLLATKPEKSDLANTQC